MPAHTIRSDGRLTVVFTRGGDAFFRRPAADGLDAAGVAIRLIQFVGDLKAGDQLIVMPAEDAPAVSRASHYSG